MHDGGWEPLTLRDNLAIPWGSFGFHPPSKQHISTGLLGSPNSSEQRGSFHILSEFSEMPARHLRAPGCF